IAGADGVGDQSENDRYGAGGLLRRHHGVVAAGQNDIRTECDQLRGVFASTLGIAGAPTLVNPHVATLDPARLPQAIQKRCQTRLSIRTIRGYAHEHADAPHVLAGLLSARRKRPRSRAAGQGDEVPPVHSITASARASTLAGISMPRALAVLRLMTSSNLVGACTGRSAGFSPLRMRST